MGNIKQDLRQEQKATKERGKEIYRLKQRCDNLEKNVRKLKCDISDLKLENNKFVKKDKKSEKVRNFHNASTQSDQVAIQIISTIPSTITSTISSPKTSSSTSQSLPVTISTSLDENSNSPPLELSVTPSVTSTTISTTSPCSVSEASGPVSHSRTQQSSPTQANQGQADAKRKSLPTFLTWSSPWTRATPTSTGPRYCGTPRLDDFELAYTGHPNPKVNTE